MTVLQLVMQLVMLPVMLLLMLFQYQALTCKKRRRRHFYRLGQTLRQQQAHCH